MFGIPPASETTSGRLATEKSARISEAVMPCGARGVPVDIAVETGAAGTGVGRAGTSVLLGRVSS